MTKNDEILAKLGEDISEKIHEFIRSRETIAGRPSLAEVDPQTAAKALMGLSANLPITRIAKELGVDYKTLVRLKSQFADHSGEWKEMAGQVSGALYVEGADLLGELFDDIRAARGDPKMLEANSKAIAAVSKSVETLGRQALTTRGEATERTETTHKYTVDDAMEAREKALQRLKQAEVIEIES